jgi:hypothetical protein
MPQVTENFRDAQSLAEYSNLKPEEVEYFRSNFPDFVPPAWWTYKAHRAEKKQWQMTQQFLRDAWQDHFKGGTYSLVRLILSVFDPKRLFDAALGLDEYGFDDSIAKPAFARLSEIEWGYIPFHRAVLYLFDNPWRARFCTECNRRFVAAEAKNKFCSEKCSHETRIRQQRASWHEHKKQWRPPRKKSKRMSPGDTKSRRVKRGGRVPAKYQRPS